MLDKHLYVQIQIYRAERNDLIDGRKIGDAGEKTGKKIERKVCKSERRRYLTNI
jgi:hypothetical protein